MTGVQTCALPISRLHRGDSVLAWALVGPPLVTAACVLAAGLNMTPRAYLLLLPAAICGAGGALVVADRIASALPTSRQPAFQALAMGTMAACAVAVHAAGLRGYYRYPKQDFRGAIRFAATRRGPADVLVGVYLAKWGLRHYGPGLGLHEGREFEVVQSVEDLEAVQKAHPDARLIPLVTLARANRLEYPDLDARLHERFLVAARFPGTLGDGEVSVWEQR